MKAKHASTEKTESTGLETVFVALGPHDLQHLEHIAEQAIDLAAPSDATVVLGHVFTAEEFEADVEALDFDIPASDVSADDLAGRHSAVRGVVELLDTAGLDYEVRGAVGNYGDRICALAEDVEADMVVVGGRGRSPAGKAVFGSVAQDVMLSAPCPVTFVRSDEH